MNFFKFHINFFNIKIKSKSYININNALLDTLKLKIFFIKFMTKLGI